MTVEFWMDRPPANATAYGFSSPQDAANSVMCRWFVGLRIMRQELFPVQCLEKGRGNGSRADARRIGGGQSDGVD